MSGGLQDLFDKHVDLLRLVSQIPDLSMNNESKLSLYALYKQATDGHCTTPKPSFFDLKGRYKHDAWAELGEMSRVEAMRKYIELIHDLVENDQFHTDQVTEDLEEIVVELNSLYADYAGRIKVLNRQTNEDFRDEQYRQATEGLFIRRREESSLFQPGAEVFYDGQNQHSILEAVQDLVQHDIVESVHDAKGFHPIQEDPLNVMEPRPIKASSEESLLRTGRSYNEVYELLMETNRRLDLLEQRLNAFLERWSLGALRLYLKGRPILARALQVAGALSVIMMALRMVYRARK